MQLGSNTRKAKAGAGQENTATECESQDPAQRLPRKERRLVCKHYEVRDVEGKK